MGVIYTKIATLNMYKNMINKYISKDGKIKKYKEFQNKNFRSSVNSSPWLYNLIWFKIYKLQSGFRIGIT